MSDIAQTAKTIRATAPAGASTTASMNHSYRRIKTTCRYQTFFFRSTAWTNSGLMIRKCCSARSR